MIRKKLYLYMLMLASVMLAACGQSEEDSIVEPTETVTLIIAAPQSSSTRADMGDPGEAVEEGEDWDEMAVIIAYTQLEGESAAGNNLPVVIKTLTKTEFEALPLYSNNSDYRMLALSVWRGTVHIYGVTYTGEATGSPRSDIHSCQTEEAVKALTISNDYASGDTKKFLSVATGYYKEDDNTGTIADYVINAKADYGEIKPIPSMRLTRLAAKIDIQWDAQDAYTQGYTDVKVESFTYNGGATFADDATDAVKKGSGRLFPGLYKGTEVLNGSATFINQTAMSKRNGRVYHYVFPDGASTPKITFELSGTKDGTETTKKPYTFKFPDKYKLQQATWYKVNTTIRGVTGKTTIIQNN